jgi:nitrite reductase/ring-hydroxylating ferredoxin subunit
LGLAGSALAAAAGFTDWSLTDGRARRIGFVHAMLNASVSALNVTSLAFRLAGNGSTGRKLSMAAFGIANVSAYLGGTLVFRERIGVDQGDDTPSESQFQTVVSAAELIDGKPHQVKVDGVPVMLVKLGGDIRAITDTCTHLGCSLSDGNVEDGKITCPCHSSQFSIEDGHVVNGPATSPETALEVRVQQGQIQLRFAPK